ITRARSRVRSDARRHHAGASSWPRHRRPPPCPPPLCPPPLDRPPLDRPPPCPPSPCPPRLDPRSLCPPRPCPPPLCPPRPCRRTAAWSVAPAPASCRRSPSALPTSHRRKRRCARSSQTL